MSKTWYPVIDLEKCIECGVCIDFCKHGVYERKNRRPVVVNPEGCVHGCRGCESQCTQGAIDYVGSAASDMDGCGCDCSCGCNCDCGE